MLESEKIAFNLVLELFSLLEQRINHHVHYTNGHTHGFLSTKELAVRSSETRTIAGQELPATERAMQALEELTQLIGKMD